MRMQVILDYLFARPGSAPIGGGKKGEFRDWTKCPWDHGEKNRDFLQSALSESYRRTQR